MERIENYIDDNIDSLYFSEELRTKFQKKCAKNNQGKKIQTKAKVHIRHKDDDVYLKNQLKHSLLDHFERKISIQRIHNRKKSIDNLKHRTN